MAVNTQAAFGDAAAGEAGASAADGLVEFGEYANTITFDDSVAGGRIQLGAEQLTILGQVEILGDGTRINAFKRSRVLKAASSQIGLKDLKLVGGRAVAGLIDGDNGGGIQANNVLLTLQNVVISDNQAVEGGGINARNSRLRMTDVKLRNNVAAVGAGVSARSTDLVMEQSLVEINRTAAKRSTPAGRGGGLLVSGGDLTIRQTTIRGNRSVGEGGGVLLNDGVGNLDAVTLASNRAAFGGGLMLTGTASADVDAATFVQNVGGPGGAIGVTSTAELGLFLRNSTLERTGAGVSLGDGAVAKVGATEFLRGTQAIRVGEGASLEVRDSLFQDGLGDAITARSGASVLLAGSTVRNMRAAVEASAESTVVVRDSLLEANTFRALSSTGDVRLVRTTVTGHRGSGGGVRISASNQDGRLGDPAGEFGVEIIDSVITGNRDAVAVIGRSVLIAGTTFGGAEGDGNFAVHGGAMDLGFNSGTPIENQRAVIRDSVFSFNTAGRDGGAIETFGRGGHLVITGTTFEQNTAGSFGGAIDLFASSLSFEIADSTFRGNRARSGGAIYTYSSVTSALGDRVSRITDTLFEQNVAGDNGGGYFADQPVEIRRSVFRENEAGISGGAIYVRQRGDVLIRTSTVRNNLADTKVDESRRRRGAGIFVDEGGELESRLNTIENNRRPDSDGIVDNVFRE